jgi:murein L,D-transpeptidase YcbB/YkuD
MSRQFDVYDDSGRKIGTAEERPGAVGQIVGAFIMFWLMWKVLEGIIALIVLIIQTLIDHPKIAISLAVVGVLIGVYAFSTQAYQANQARLVAEQQAQAQATSVAIRQGQTASILSNMTVGQIKNDLIDRSITASGITWHFDRLSEFLDVTINGRKQNGRLLEYDVSMKLQDYKSGNLYNTQVLVVYDDTGHFVSVTAKSLERVQSASLPASSGCDGVQKDTTEPHLYLRSSDWMNGARVEFLQRRLLELGYSLPSGADGWFGPETEAAVKEFQRRNRLEVDGYAGPITWACLKNPNATRGN